MLWIPLYMYLITKRKKEKKPHICEKYLFSYLLRKFEVIYIHVQFF